MATPVEFTEQSLLLKGDPSRGVKDLPVFRDGGQFISCWKLDPAEIVEIMNTGVVWLRVFGAESPAVFVTGEYPFEKIVN